MDLFEDQEQMSRRVEENQSPLRVLKQSPLTIHLQGRVHSDSQEEDRLWLRWTMTPALDPASVELISFHPLSPPLSQESGEDDRAIPDQLLSFLADHSVHEEPRWWSEDLCLLTPLRRAL